MKKQLEGGEKVSEKIYRLNLLFGEKEQKEMHNKLREAYPFEEKEIWEEIEE